MESMTGYAFLEKSSDQFSYSIEMKSLNSKYLEVYVNLPKILRTDENDFVKLIKQNFTRGKIELSVDIFNWSDTKPISINLDVLIKYYKELLSLHDSLKIKEPLRFESLLVLEGITQRERSVLSDKSRKDLIKSLKFVIQKTQNMRKEEGLSTKKDITSCLSEISNDCMTIKSLFKNVVEEKREALKAKLTDLIEDNSRIYAEIAILADKLDINEELVRINDHLKKFKIFLKEKGQLGRKLDFLSQELFREINTIASKSNNSEISYLVVNVKNNIDKIREQCRNIV